MNMKSGMVLFLPSKTPPFFSPSKLHRITNTGTSPYPRSPNPGETADFDLASLNILFLSLSSTLFRLSFISLRSVSTCFLIAFHTRFLSRLSSSDEADENEEEGDDVEDVLLV